MNDEMKQEAVKREWIEETMAWAREHSSKATIAEWIGWATSRLEEPWTK